jgi:hypothetical protein
METKHYSWHISDPISSVGHYYYVIPLPHHTTNNRIRCHCWTNLQSVFDSEGTGPSAGYTFVFLFLFTGFLVWLTGNKMKYMYVITIICLIFLTAFKSLQHPQFLINTLGLVRRGACGVGFESWCPPFPLPKEQKFENPCNVASVACQACLWPSSCSMSAL